MSFLLPPLPPHFDAALRDVGAQGVDARLAAARRLARPDPGREAEARTGLGALLGDRDARVRAAAVEALADVGTPGDHDALRQRLQDTDPMVREVAVVALAAIPHPNRNAVLLHALRSEHPEVRFQALSCCAETCPGQAREDFVAATRDDDPRVRQNAARLLGARDDWSGEPPVRERLRAMLDDPDPGVTFEAALAIGPADPERAARRLLEGLQVPALRLRATVALARHDRPEVRAALRGIAESFLKPAEQRVAAAAALLELGEEDAAVEALRRVLRRWRGAGRVEALEAAAARRLGALRPEVARLAHRGRGAVGDAARRALQALDGRDGPERPGPGA